MRVAHRIHKDTQMRTSLFATAALAVALSLSTHAAELPQPAAPANAVSTTDRILQSDTPSTTSEGTRFIAPAGWTIRSTGAAVILTPPETGARMALVDVRARDADAAVAAAWTAFGPRTSWPLKLAADVAPRDGWEQIRDYAYETSANDHLLVAARAFRRGALWTVAVGEVSLAIAEKRGAQFALVQNRLLPKDHRRESFAGRTANPLTADRIATLRTFIEDAQRQLGVPGVAMGLVQDGKTVFAGGFGVRELGKPDPVDADTRFLVASNTKAMTTLMLARLVDAKRFDWDTPVTHLLPDFRLGDAQTTRQVRVKHLVCACTGLPRQDYEWLFEYEAMTPAGALQALATMQPTSDFGALYQYSNPLSAAGGFVGGHVLHPDRELGAAYDAAMQSMVFDPLGMRDTTFDFTRALRGNHAAPHAADVDGKPAAANMALNDSIMPVRPAGGAWSTVNDMLRYVRMELDNGVLPDGTRYVSEQALHARREPQVKTGDASSYGMGLMIERGLGVPVVSHGGSMIGYQTGMLWLPEHGFGAVVLTNSNQGVILLGLLKRRLMEVLFDGEPQAEASLALATKRLQDGIAAERKRLQVPADAGEAGKLAPRYRNAALGEIRVHRSDAATVFDFGGWRSEVASRRNDDGTVSFVTLAPGADGFELVPTAAAGLVLRDAQHEYVFDAAKPEATASGGAR